MILLKSTPIEIGGGKENLKAMMATEHGKQVAAALQIVIAVGEAIQEMGRVPSGHLYATLMGVLTLEQYERAIDLLVQAGSVRRERSEELVWIGPRKERN